MLCVAALLLLCGGRAWAQAPAAPVAAQAPVPAPASAAVSVPSGVQIAMDAVELVDFLRFMGQLLGAAPVFREDQIPAAKVTIVSQQALSPAEARELFAAVLQAAGLQVSRRGEVPYVLPATTGAPRPRPGQPPLGPAGPFAPAPPAVPLSPDAHILVRTLSPLAASRSLGVLAAVLDRLRSDQGQVAGAPAARSVLVADAPARVALLRPVLEALAEAAEASARAAGGVGLSPETGPFQAEILPLHRAQARLAARKFDMYAKGQRGAAALVLPLEWSNSLLLAGDAAPLVLARRFVAQLDDGGAEVPALRAFRTRFIRPELLAEAMTALLAAEKKAAPEGAGAGLGEARVRVDAEGGAVLVLAEPGVMARLERLAEDLDQPRLRVYIEALAVLLPPALERELTVLPPPADGALGIRTPSGAGRAFALARIGSVAALRGRAAEAPQYGLDSLAVLLGQEADVRVLALSRLAVQDGGEARVSDVPAGQSLGGRVRMTLSPRVERGTGLVQVTLSAEDLALPGQVRSATAQLAEGQVLLLLGGEALSETSPRQEAARSSLFSPPPQAVGPGRLCVVLSARVVRPAKTAPMPVSPPAQAGGGLTNP
jgi:hypothetical protein